MKKIVRFMISMMLIALPFSGMAAENKFYVGGAYGTAHYSGDGPLFSSDTTPFAFQPGQSFSGNDGTFSLYLGYHFNNFVSVELSYADLGGVSNSFKGNGVPPDHIPFIPHHDGQRAKADNISFSVIAGSNITKKLDVFMELGFSHMEFDVEGYYSSTSLDESYDRVVRSSSLTGLGSSGNGIVFGVGGRYEITDRISARLQWRRHVMDRLDIDTATLGIEFGF